MTSFIIAVLSIVLGISLLQFWMRTKSRKSVGSIIPEEFTKDQFFDGNEKKLLFFFSPSCNPCKKMIPDIDALRNEHPERVKKINVGQSLDLSRAIKVMATPTIVLVQDKKVVDIKLGYANRKQIETLLNLA